MKIERIHWIDSLRGIAIVMMVIFHFAFNLDYLDIKSIALYSGFWLVFVRIIQFLFLGLVGVSLYLSYQNQKTYRSFLHFQMKRAVKLFAVALLITVVTYFVVPEAYIRFGVIHFISVAIAIGALFVRFPRVLTVLMILIPIPAALFSEIVLNTPLLLPIGIVPRGFFTVDYFPLFPWLSIVFAGIVAAYLLDYFKLLKNAFYSKRLVFLEKIGKKSLWIYLIHQPILLGLIYLLFK